jgi:hypothetical protein
MAKKSTHWVTIPEETIHTPASKSSKKEGKMSGKSKLFWGAGFVVVVIVTFALLAPQQMANILQGNLFEQSGIQPLEVIPVEDDTDVQVEVEPEPETAESEDDIAVEAETEAVSIQIEPVTVEEPVEELAEEAVEEPDEEEPAGSIQEELDANRQLLEELSKQIAEFKEKDEEKTAIIEDLTGMVQDQAEGEIRPSASEIVPSAVSTTTVIGQPGYKVNTHTVAVTPHQVLQQNTAQLQAQQYVAADLTAQDYNAQLAAAQGTPDSGPKEVLLFSLVLSFLALLGWKIGKLARA